MLRQACVSTLICGLIVSTVFPSSIFAQISRQESNDTPIRYIKPTRSGDFPSPLEAKSKEHIKIRSKKGVNGILNIEVETRFAATEEPRGDQWLMVVRGLLEAFQREKLTELERSDLEEIRILFVGMSIQTGWMKKIGELFLGNAHAQSKKASMESGPRGTALTIYPDDDMWTRFWRGFGETASGYLANWEAVQSGIIAMISGVVFSMVTMNIAVYIALVAVVGATKLYTWASYMESGQYEKLGSDVFYLIHDLVFSMGAAGFAERMGLGTLVRAMMAPSIPKPAFEPPPAVEPPPVKPKISRPVPRMRTGKPAPKKTLRRPTTTPKKNQADDDEYWNNLIESEGFPEEGGIVTASAKPIPSTKSNPRPSASSSKPSGRIPTRKPSSTTVPTSSATGSPSATTAPATVAMATTSAFAFGIDFSFIRLNEAWFRNLEPRLVFVPKYNVYYRLVPNDHPYRWAEKESQFASAGRRLLSKPGMSEFKVLLGEWVKIQGHDVYVQLWVGTELTEEALKSETFETVADIAWSIDQNIGRTMLHPRYADDFRMDGDVIYAVYEGNRVFFNSENQGLARAQAAHSTSLPAQQEKLVRETVQNTPERESFEDDFVKLSKALSGDAKYYYFLVQKAEQCRLGRSGLSEQMCKRIRAIVESRSAKKRSGGGDQLTYSEAFKAFFARYKPEHVSLIIEMLDKTGLSKPFTNALTKNDFTRAQELVWYALEESFVGLFHPSTYLAYGEWTDLLNMEMESSFGNLQEKDIASIVRLVKANHTIEDGFLDKFKDRTKDMLEWLSARLKEISDDEAKRLAVIIDKQVELIEQAEICNEKLKPLYEYFDANPDVVKALFGEMPQRESRYVILLLMNYGLLTEPYDFEYFDKTFMALRNGDYWDARALMIYLFPVFKEGVSPQHDLIRGKLSRIHAEDSKKWFFANVDQAKADEFFGPIPQNTREQLIFVWCYVKVILGQYVQGLRLLVEAINTGKGNTMRTDVVNVLYEKSSEDIGGAYADFHKNRADFAETELSNVKAKYRSYVRQMLEMSLQDTPSLGVKFNQVFDGISFDRAVEIISMLYEPFVSRAGDRYAAFQQQITMLPVYLPKLFVSIQKESVVTSIQNMLSRLQGLALAKRDEFKEEINKLKENKIKYTEAAAGKSPGAAPVQTTSVVYLREFDRAENVLAVKEVFRGLEARPDLKQEARRLIEADAQTKQAMLDAFSETPQQIGKARRALLELLRKIRASRASYSAQDTKSAKNIQDLLKPLKSETLAASGGSNGGEVPASPKEEKTEKSVQESKGFKVVETAKLLRVVKGLPRDAREQYQEWKNILETEGYEKLLLIKKFDFQRLSYDKSLYEVTIFNSWRIFFRISIEERTITDVEIVHKSKWKVKAGGNKN